MPREANRSAATSMIRSRVAAPRRLVLARPEYVDQPRPAPYTGGEVKDAATIAAMREAGRLAAQALAEVGEFYYVMNGQGTVTIGSESAQIRTGDAVPIQLNDRKSFENTGTTPLEFLIVGVAKDADRKYDVVTAPPMPARGGPCR